MRFISSHNCNRGKLESQIFLKLLIETKQTIIIFLFYYQAIVGKW